MSLNQSIRLRVGLWLLRPALRERRWAQYDEWKSAPAGEQREIAFGVMTALHRMEQGRDPVWKVW